LFAAAAASRGEILPLLWTGSGLCSGDRFEQLFESQIEIDDNSIPVNILTVLQPSEQNTSANQCKQKKISLEKFTYFESKLLCTTPDKED
jgi:hypothetical protein